MNPPSLGMNPPPLALNPQMMLQARKLLRPHGILLLVTPHSSDPAATKGKPKQLTEWKAAMEGVGFRQHKREVRPAHTTCCVLAHNRRDSVNNGRDLVNNGRDSLNNGRDSLNNGHDSLNNGRDSVNNGCDSVNNGRDSVNNNIQRQLYRCCAYRCDLFVCSDLVSERTLLCMYCPYIT
jgi:hypothetical protein